MRNLAILETHYVSGGEGESTSAPDCTVSDSGAVSCTCPEGTTMVTAQAGNAVVMTCAKTEDS